MKRFLEKLIPQSKILGTLLVGVVMSLMLAGLMCLPPLLREDVFFIYGMAVFCGVPFFVGLLTPLVIGYKREASLGESFGFSFLALVIVGCSLLFFALEGLICLIMASPLVFGLMIFGAVAGHNLQKAYPQQTTNIFRSFLLFVFFLPSMSFVENRIGQNQPELIPVTTSIEINAPPEKVWKNVVEFPELAPPTEFLFKTGIAYPIRARIDGAGVGAIRYCEFSTGAFVEPIKVWDENKLLRFSVKEQPVPMRELSPYGELDTPHLHDYFVSSKGEFKLTRLENGNTRLDGTTWYYHKISPEFYWQIWTEQIVHAIHQRVLNHIKEQSEKNQAEN